MIPLARLYIYYDYRSEGGRSTGREGFSYSDLLEAGQAGQPVTRTEADAPNEFDVYHAVPNY